MGSGKAGVAMGKEFEFWGGAASTPHRYDLSRAP